MGIVARPPRTDPLKTTRSLATIVAQPPARDDPHQDAPHILMLLSNAYTNDPRVRNEARSLRAHGYEVSVVAWDRAGDEDPQETLDDGVRVFRVRNNAWMRVLPFDLARLRPWWRAAYRHGRAVARAHPVDAIHAHDLDTLPAGVRLKRALGVPLVYDAHELWGEMIRRDVPVAVPGIAHRMERRLLHHVDQMITVNTPLFDHYRPLLPARASLEIIRNAKPLAWDTYEPPPEGAFKVLYIGRLSKVRFIVESIHALSGLEGVELIIAGVGKPEYMAEVEAAAADAPNVTYLGKVANDTVLPRTRACHVVLNLLDPSDPNNVIGSSNKQFEAMAAGRPILCTEGTNNGRIATEVGHGLALPLDKQALREIVLQLAADRARVDAMGRLGFEAAKREYNWPAQERKLIAAYEALGLKPIAARPS